MLNLHLKLKDKILLMNLGIFIPIIIFVYAVILNTLYSNTLKTGADYLLRESFTSQIYIDQYLRQYNNHDIMEHFRDSAPLFATYLSGKLNFRVQLYDRSGNLLSDSLKNALSMYADDITTALHGHKTYIIKKAPDGTTFILFSIPIYYGDELLGVIRYVYPMQREFTSLYRIIIIMSLAVLFAIISSLLLSNIFAQKITGPIKQLKEGSEKIARGNYDFVIRVNSGDELESLANAFNQAALSIHTYIENLKAEKQKQKLFFDNVTHEFKTPLTAIIGYANLLPRLKDKAAISDSISYIESEGKRLLKLVEELLTLVRLGKNEFDVEPQPTDFTQLLADVLNILAPRLEAQHLRVEVDTFPCVLPLDADKTQQVLLNIIDNALRYSEATRLSLRMTTVSATQLLKQPEFSTIIPNETYLLVSINDNGLGIDEDIYTSLLSPFTQGYTKRCKGNGLGLAICKTIMEKQQGLLLINSTPGTGTTVELYFPYKEVSPHHEA